MATKHSSIEINTDSEVSDSDTEWDDSEEDPDYDALEETRSNLSNLSLKHKARASVVEDKGLGEEVTASDHNRENFEKVQKLIEVGLLEKLKVDECKLYLRKNGLRLTGNKDTLTQRIKEHLEILNGGEKKYPPSSFVLNCKGDACTGDVVLFEQNVYEIFNIVSRSASGPSCGKRIVAGRIVKENYGAAKQQHTFTIEVLWSKGEKPLPPLYPLLIKGRNLYRLKTMRQKWEDEANRQKILMEKHSRGSLARADREARIKEKEHRKKFKENRVPKNDSARNQCQSHSHITRPQHHPQETNVPNNPEKPEFPSRNSGFSTHRRKETSSMVNKSAAVTKQHDKSTGKTFTVQHMHNQQAWNCITRRTSSIDHMRKAEVSANNNQAEPRFTKKPAFIAEKTDFTGLTHHRIPLPNSNHPCISERTGFTGLNHHRVPLANNANNCHPLVHNRESYKSKQFCRHYFRGRCYFGDNCKFLHDLGDKGNA